MDILFWTKLNPNILIGEVKRSYYNQYHFKLEINMVGSSFLRDPTKDIAEQLETREKINRQVNFGGSWRASRLRVPNANEIAALEWLRDNKTAYETDIKFRIEEPYLQAYSANETKLHQFAEAMCTAVGNNNNLFKINRPASNQHLDIIKQGYTIRNRENGYPYKVYVREGRYSQATKKAIHAFLVNAKDQVQMTTHFEDALLKKYESIWNCYFYVKDKSILTMLSLIDPRFVRSIDEYHVPPDDK